MNPLSTFTRTGVLALAIGMCGTATFAQTPPTPPSAPTAGTSSTTLTSDEKAEYKKALDQVLAANPDLKTQYDDLHQQISAQRSQGASVSRADRAALMTKMADFMTQKVRPEMLKLDANLQPIFDKMDAARKARMNAAAASQT